MGDQSEGLVRDVYQAFGRGDVPTVLGAMAADMEWHEAEGMPYGGVYHGGEAVVQNVFGPIMQDVSDFAVTPEEFIASGDAVAAVVRYTGTGKATGK
jgi:ketosteroid isomerase-like protein